MELIYFSDTTSSGYSRQVRELLKLADREFVPPLSTRGSSTQADLSAAQALEAGVDAYFETMQTQPVVLEIENGKCLGFMAFKENYTCSEICNAPVRLEGSIGKIILVSLCNSV